GARDSRVFSCILPGARHGSALASPAGEGGTRNEEERTRFGQSRVGPAPVHAGDRKGKARAGAVRGSFCRFSRELSPNTCALENLIGRLPRCRVRTTRC